MKNINKWVNEYVTGEMTFYGLLKSVQDDAYNQAIEDAAEAATVEETDVSIMSYYRVDKKSILDLKIKKDEIKSDGD